MRPDLERALARTEARLAVQDRASLVLARAGEPDIGVAVAVAEELSQRQLPDGSWGGDLMRTAEVLLLLFDISPVTAMRHTDPVVQRAKRWLRSRQHAAGRFGDGCAPDLHQVELCHHYIGGFFSPGPIPSAGVALPSGARVTVPSDARVVASCMALRALIRWWGVESPDETLHLDGLTRVLRLAPPWTGGPVGPPGRLAALAALIEAQRPADQGVIEAFLRTVARSQRADGTWPEADQFQVLETLEAAANAGYWNDALAGALARAVELLATSQQESGGWGRDTPVRQLWIAAQALRRALGRPNVHARPPLIIR